RVLIRSRVFDLDGKVLLLGVDHTVNTTVHLAEALAGVPYRVPKYCTVLRNGLPVRVDFGEIDHCCRNFALVGEWLNRRSLERRGEVGSARARLVRARDVVATVVEELRDDPLRFLCPRGAGCSSCDEAWASVGWRRIEILLGRAVHSSRGCRSSCPLRNRSGHVIGRMVCKP